MLRAEDPLFISKEFVWDSNLIFGAKIDEFNILPLDGVWTSNVEPGYTNWTHDEFFVTFEHTIENQDE